MRQYTTPEQTAKLVELGFEMPKGLADAEPSSGKWVREAYSIGELIEMLPNFSVRMQYHHIEKWWWIGYYDESIPVGLFCFELCDALYEFILALKDLGRL